MRDKHWYVGYQYRTRGKDDAISVAYLKARTSVAARHAARTIADAPSVTGSIVISPNDKEVIMFGVWREDLA